MWSASDMVTVFASYWSPVRHGNDLPLESRRSLDLCRVQWNNPYLYVLLLRLLYNEMGVSFAKTIHYMVTDDTICDRIGCLWMLLFCGGLLEDTREEICVLLYICLRFDEPIHVHQLL
mgnify:CR=1 FL=1